MTMGKMGQWMPGGLLLPALLVATGCSERKPPSEERSVEENLSDTRSVMSPAVPVSAAPPASVRAETPRKPPPAETPSAEALMQDDAAASGMTSQMSSAAETGEPLASENSN